MILILSRYNHDMSWIKDYPDDSFIVYDRSEEPIEDSIIVPNIGSDIYDKLTYVIDNYDNLPDVAIYAKANIFKYITKPEFDQIKDNKEFTPILTKHHEEKPGVSYYKDGIYWETNNLWYLGAHPVTHDPYELMEFTGIGGIEYVPFAPGSNYILTKEDIHKHPLDFYIKLRSYLESTIYGGECMIIERSLYTIWK